MIYGVLDKGTIAFSASENSINGPKSGNESLVFWLRKIMKAEARPIGRLGNVPKF